MMLSLDVGFEDVVVACLALIAESTLLEFGF